MDSKPITMINAKGNEAVVGSCQVAEWQARGYSVKDADAVPKGDEPKKPAKPKK